MRAFLPIFWFSIAGMSALAGVFAQSPWFNEDTSQVAYAALPRIAVATIGNLTVGILYLLMLRTTSDQKVVFLGWAHAGSYIIAAAMGTWMTFYRNRALVSGERVQPTELLVHASVQTLFFALATLSFFAVAFCAYQDSRRTIDMQQFD